MVENSELLNRLISLYLAVPSNSLEHKRAFKRSSALLKQFHPLEVDPKKVEDEVNDVCYKLDVNSLSHKSNLVRKLYHKVVRFCCEADSYEEKLLPHGIVLFLLEIHGSMLDTAFEEGFIYENEETDLIGNDNTKWFDILTKSEDIRQLIRDDYGSDTSSEYFSDEEETNIDLNTADKESQISNNVDINDLYRVVKDDHKWSANELEDVCSLSLQPEYWLTSYQTKPLSSALYIGADSSFVTNVEYSMKLNKLNDFLKRVEMSEYQLVREIIDVLFTPEESFIYLVNRNDQYIGQNYYKLKHSCKLLSLSWTSVDNILREFGTLASHCLVLKIVSQYVIHNSYNNRFSASIVAFAERLQVYLNRFMDFVHCLEMKSKDTVGLTLFELYNSMFTWISRMQFLRDIVYSITMGRFEALEWDSTVISLVDLLYKVMNECCLSLIDDWIAHSSLDIFNHTFKPYLFFIDSLLSGQPLLSTSHNLFLIPTNDDEKFICRDNILHYWKTNFTIFSSSLPNSSKIQIPILLQPFLIYLISTIKSIDLLRVLSVELTKPRILNSIVVDLGNLTRHFHSEFAENRSTELRSIYQFALRDDFVLPDKSTLAKRIFDDLIVKTQCIIHKPDCSIPNSVPLDILKHCRTLHRNIMDDILARYRCVADHLMATLIDELHLRQAMIAIRSVYFMQAGFEMSDYLTGLFDILLHSSYGSADVALLLNLRLQQVLSESVNNDLIAEGPRFSVRVSDDFQSKSKVDYVLGFIDAVLVEYSVEWYLRIVVSSDLVSLCNRCMSFLVKLRLAKHCLEMAMLDERCQAHKPVSFRPTAYRLNAQRLKLLQIINSLHGYIMNSFVAPGWSDIDRILDDPQSHCSDFSDFLECLTGPFQGMARGCLQTDELTGLRKAINKLIHLSIETSQLDVGCSVSSFRSLETEYRRLIDFIATLFSSLSNYGISLNGLDISAFQ